MPYVRRTSYRRARPISRRPTYSRRRSSVQMRRRIPMRRFRRR